MYFKLFKENTLLKTNFNATNYLLNIRKTTDKTFSIMKNNNLSYFEAIKMQLDKM